MAEQQLSCLVLSKSEVLDILDAHQGSSVLKSQQNFLSFFHTSSFHRNEGLPYRLLI